MPLTCFCGACGSLAEQIPSIPCRVAGVERSTITAFKYEILYRLWRVLVRPREGPSNTWPTSRGNGFSSLRRPKRRSFVLAARYGCWVTGCRRVSLYSFAARRSLGSKRKPWILRLCKDAEKLFQDACHTAASLNICNSKWLAV